jgi:hypothetical protein
LGVYKKEGGGIMKIVLMLINILYGIVGGINIVVGMIYKNFYQLTTGLLFIVLLIDRLTIGTLHQIIKEKEKNL